jgi:hypothetical protein
MTHPAPDQNHRLRSGALLKNFQAGWFRGKHSTIRGGSMLVWAAEGSFQYAVATVNGRRELANLHTQIIFRALCDILRASSFTVGGLGRTARQSA